MRRRREFFYVFWVFQAENTCSIRAINHAELSGMKFMKTLRSIEAIARTRVSVLKNSRDALRIRRSAGAMSLS